MFRPVKMLKVNVLILDKHLNAITQAMGRIGLIHLVDAVSQSKNHLLDDVDRACDIDELERLASRCQSLLDKLGSDGKPPSQDTPALSRAKINDLSVEISRLARLRSELRTEQDRVRKNLDLLRKVRGNGRLRAKVTKNLGKLSDQLAKLTGQYVKADQERSQRRRQMRALIGTITLDNTAKK